MSGAGKSQALKAFEDLGYYCVDNLLPQLITEVAKTLNTGGMQEFKKIALVVDSRGGGFFNGIYSILDLLKQSNISYRLLFLDATDETLINRYKETRRFHPLSPKGIPSVGVTLERKLTAPLKKLADEIIDTSQMQPKTLKQEIYKRFDLEQEAAAVNIISFGFKRGIPPDSDYVFDCRFLPNPFNVDALRPLTGLDGAVYDYVSGQKKFAPFVKGIVDMVKLVLDEIQEDGRRTLIVAIGCTGGKHRSVSVSRKVCGELKKKKISAVLQHRDIYID